MIERQMSDEEARRRFDDIRKRLELGEPIHIPTAEEVNDAENVKGADPADENNGNVKLEDLKPMKEFTAEDAEKMNRRYPDTF